MFTPPNNRLASNVGRSSDPSGAGMGNRGEMPNGNRFRLPDPTAGFPAAPVAPGSGAVPIEPFGQSGAPRQSSGLPDDASQYRRGR